MPRSLHIKVLFITFLARKYARNWLKVIQRASSNDVGEKNQTFKNRIYKTSVSNLEHTILRLIRKSHELIPVEKCFINRNRIKTNVFLSLSSKF